MSNYEDFIREKGRPVSEINPGSNEMALSANDALSAIELLKNECVGILGGDILSEVHRELGYATHLWGYEYHYLNWYCNKESKESVKDYLERSYIMAKKAISDAVKVSEELKRECFIVLVV